MDTMGDTQAGRGHLARAQAAPDLRHRRVRLTREPYAAALARGEVRAAIAAWDVSVDADIAVLLASDLVTNAIARGEGRTITLAIRCTAGRLRVDVYDTWRALPVVLDAGASAATGPGLALVATLADEWGTFRTPAGMAVYFTLGRGPADEEEEERQELLRGDGGLCPPGLHVGTAGCDAPRQSAVLTASVRCHRRMRANVGSVTVSRPQDMQQPGSLWLKSSLSYANGNCVEVAGLPGGEIGIRNSRDSAGPVLKFTSEEWRAFLGGVRNGEFDGLAS
jgi:hypothetical protein